MGKVNQAKPPRVCISKALFRYRQNRANGVSTYQNHLIREFSVCHNNGKIRLLPINVRLVDFDGGLHDNVDCIVNIDPLDFTPQEYAQIICKLRNATNNVFDFVHEHFALSAGCIYLKKKIPNVAVATKIIIENMHRYVVEQDDDELLRLPPDFEMLLREQTQDFSSLFGSVEEHAKL